MVSRLDKLSGGLTDFHGGYQAFRALPGFQGANRLSEGLNILLVEFAVVYDLYSA